MKYSIKDIAIIALVAALTVVLGYVFYAIGSFFPVPGHKFMVFAPFLGFMMFIPACKTKRIGVMTVFSLVFGFIMTHISFFMALAIVFAGITADLITLIIFHNYKKTWKIIASVGIYPVTSVLSAFIVSYYFTGNALYKLVGGWLSITILCLVIYALGVIGAHLSNKIVYARIVKARMYESNSSE